MATPLFPPFRDFPVESGCHASVLRRCCGFPHDSPLKDNTLCAPSPFRLAIFSFRSYGGTKVHGDAPSTAPAAAQALFAKCSAGQPANREERMCLRAVQPPSFLLLTSRHDFLERLRFYSAALDAEANTAQSDAAEPAAMPDGGFHSQRWGRFLDRGLLVALVKSRPMFQHSRTGKAAVFSTGNG